jgi:hypothetical protein
VLRRERAFSLVNTRWVIRSEVGLMYLDLCRSVLFLVRSSDDGPDTSPPKVDAFVENARVGGRYVRDVRSLYDHLRSTCTLWPKMRYLEISESKKSWGRM